jgi:hypothetical protein
MGGVQAPAKLLGLSTGQSLRAYTYTRGTPRVAADWAEQLRTLFGYPVTRGFASYTSGSMFHDGATINATDWTVKLLNAAAVGSALIGGNTSSSERIAGNYWYNDADYTAETGRAEETSGSWGPLARAAFALITANPGLSFVDWGQGETDSGQLTWPFVNDASNPKNALYKTVNKALFTALRTTAGNPNLPIFITHLGRSQVATNGGYQALRDIQTEIASEMANVIIGAEQYDVRMAAAAQTLNAGITSGSLVVTMASTTGWGVNDAIEGPGIPAGAYVASVQTNVSVTMAAGFEATATSTSTVYRMDSVHPYPGATPPQVLDTAGNTTHDTAEGLYAINRRLARAIAAYAGFGSVSKWRGPSIASASAPVNGSTVDLAIAHDGGSDVSVPNIVAPYRVELDGVSKTISSVAKINASTIRLTLSAPVAAGVVKVWYGFGAMNRRVPTDFVRDNATPLVMPLRPIAGLVATR